MDNRLSYPKNKSFTSFTMLTMIFCVMTLAGGAFFYLQKSSTLNRLRPIGLGLNTCFFRLNQTFTARMINEKSAKYLGADFIADTENCLADLATLEADADSKIGQKINHLSSVAHQFHSSLEMAKSVFTRNTEDGIGPLSYYKKLESTKFEIENLIEKNASSWEKILNRFQWGLGVNIILLVFLAFKVMGGVTSLESAAATFAQKGEDYPLAAKNITTVLHENNILPAQQDSVQKNSLAWVNEKTAMAGTLENEKAIEEIWQTSEAQETQETPAEKSPQPQFVSAETLNQTETILLEDVISKSLERISAKVFSDGITIDLNLKDNVQLDAASEELTDQIIYQTLSSLLAGNYVCQSLGITMDGNDNESLNYNLEISAIYHPDSHLFADSNRPKGLDIASALAHEARIDFKVQSMTSTEGKVIGQKVTVAYSGTPAEKSTGPKLVQVRKTTKKQLMQELG